MLALRRVERIGQRLDDEQPAEHQRQQGEHDLQQPPFARAALAPPEDQRPGHAGLTMSSAAGRPPALCAWPGTTVRPLASILVRSAATVAGLSIVTVTPRLPSERYSM